jgi:hypothetical protein
VAKAFVDGMHICKSSGVLRIEEFRTSTVKTVAILSLWPSSVSTWLDMGELSRPLKKCGNSGFILRQAQDEVERFQWLGPHGELVEPWAASFFSILLAAFCIA